jgi:hypothetical protein
MASHPEFEKQSSKKRVNPAYLYARGWKVSSPHSCPCQAPQYVQDLRNINTVQTCGLEKSLLFNT